MLPLRIPFFSFSFTYFDLVKPIKGENVKFSFHQKQINIYLISFFVKSTDLSQQMFQECERRFFFGDGFFLLWFLCHLVSFILSHFVHIADVSETNYFLSFLRIIYPLKADSRKWWCVFFYSFRFFFFSFFFSFLCDSFVEYSAGVGRIGFVGDIVYHFLFRSYSSKRKCVDVSVSLSFLKRKK